MNEDLSNFRKKPDPQRLQSLRHFLEVEMPDIVAKREGEWKRLAGEHLDLMLESREEAIKQLSAPSAKMRNAAYQVLLKTWKTGSDILPQCMSAMESDSDTEVRIQALYYFAAFYNEKGDLAASEFLAKIGLSLETPVRLREAAYLGLLRIHGLPLNSRLLRSVKSGDQSAFADIDWSFVKKFV